MEKNIILVPHTYRKSIHIELQDANLMLLFDGFKNKNNNEDPYIFMTKDEDNHYMIDTVIESETII
ncbi:MAG: hypothetical protein E7I78_08415 [Staphylococcus lugdunensis]|nr:hypothetical protein [Staphylococcus lugdunensis]